MSQSLNLAHTERLSSIPIFEDLDRVTLAKLATHFEVVEFNIGESVFHEGAPADALYIVLEGLFSAYSASEDGADAWLSSFHPGEPFGEMALLTDQPRSASIIAEMAGEVLRLDRSRFLSLVQQEPAVLHAIARILSERLVVSHAQLSRNAAAHIHNGETEPKTDAASRANEPRSPKRPRYALFGAYSAGAVLAAGALVPAPAQLPVAGWQALVMMLAAVPMFIFRTIPEGILALLLASAWVLSGVVPVHTALNGFTSTGWVLVVSVLIVGAAISSSGVLFRLARWLVAHTRGGFLGQITTLSVTGVLLGPAVPNATGRVTLLAPVLGELSEAIGYAPKSRGAAGLAMAGLMGLGQMAGTFLTSSTTAVLVLAVLPASTQSALDWVSWAWWAAPPNVLLLLGLIVAIWWMYRPRHDGEKASRPSDVLEVQRMLLGAPTRQEWISLVVGGGLLLGFVTQPLHGVHPAWVVVLGLAVMSVLGVVTNETLRMVNWNFALLFGVLVSMTAVFKETGADTWLIHLGPAYLGALTASPILFVAAFTVFCFAISFVLRWQAAAPLLTIALAPVAASAGIDPFIVGLIAVMACNGFFLPYQSTTYLALYHGTKGALFTHEQARPAALAYALLTLLALCASVPIWQAMGLL